jgi:alcohol dehydrogenase
MRALVAGPRARMRWRSVPAPAAPGPEQAIVRPLAASTCDVDCPLALGAMNLALPVHLGHECVAEVLAVGERVSSVEPGDRVVVPFQISCGSCSPCRAGCPGSCLSVPPLSAFGMGVGGGHFGGAFSDELVVPYADAMLVPLPDGIAPAAAVSLSDNIADAYRHIAPHLPTLLATDADAQVLIIAGFSRRPLLSASVALYAGQIALALGARNVHLVDSRAEVRAHAERLGLIALKPRELRGRPPAPLVVHSSADPRCLHQQRRPAPPHGHPPDPDVHPPLHPARRHSARAHQHSRRARVDRLRKAAPRAGHHQHRAIRRRSTCPA